MTTHAARVAIVAYPGLQALDVVGPHEVFSTANRRLAELGAPPAYELELLGTSTEPFRCSSGLAIVADRRLEDHGGDGIDTLIVPGGDGTERAFFDDDLIAWIARTAPRCRRVVSVCVGAFLLARAGILDGRRATTHWSRCAQLAELFPAVDVQAEPIFVRDHHIWTSAGVTAGLDLALALVEEDHGRDLALDVARWLVLFLRRPGGQSQFSAQLDAQLAERDVLRDLQTWIVDHPDADLSVSALARRAAMSERNFARVFAREVGVTPAEYVERVRVEAGRRLLETTAEGVAAVACRCGYASPDTFQRAFVRQLGVNPRDYRRRFAGHDQGAHP